MQFFTPDWACGDLDDNAFDRVLPAYNRHLSTFDQSGRIIQFATTIGLNDAFLDRIDIDPSEDSIKLLLVTGSNQVGYWRTTLIYRSAQIVEGLADLKTALSARPTEIWYDEFTRGEDGYSHGFLLAPARSSSVRSSCEFRIRFESFDFSQTPAEDRTLLTVDDQSQWASADLL